MKIITITVALLTSIAASANDVGFRIVDDQVNLNFKSNSVTTEKALELEGIELYWEGEHNLLEYGLYLSTSEEEVSGNKVSTEYFDARVGVNFYTKENFKALVGFQATDYEIILDGTINPDSVIQVNSLTDHAFWGFIAAKYDNGKVQIRTELDTSGNGSAEAKVFVFKGAYLESGYKFDTLQEEAAPSGTFAVERERAYMGAGWRFNF